jgi:hypothetical protein
MVQFEDTGTLIDVPLHRLEEFLNSDEHGSTHDHAVRNFTVREKVGPTTVLAYERTLKGGPWTPSVTRLSEFRPLCVVVEDLEGDLAGSKFVAVYRSEGERTRIDLFGDIRSPRWPEDEAKQIFLDTLAEAHAEDVAALERYRRSR